MFQRSALYCSIYGNCFLVPYKENTVSNVLYYRMLYVHANTIKLIKLYKLAATFFFQDNPNLILQCLSLIYKLKHTVL